MFKPEIQKMLNKLRGDNSSGASELINNALAIIQFQLDLISNDNENIKELILDLSREIINSRPSMAPLINTIGYIIGDKEVLTKKGIIPKLYRFRADKLKRETTLEKNFRRFTTSITRMNPKIMVISYSSTLLNLLLNIKEFNAEFYVLESRPLLEGRRTAENLSKKFKTHMIIDAAIGKFIDHIDLVLIGIDSILKDGSVINKIGTFPLAVMAYQKGIDVYAIGTSFKYNIKSHYGLNVRIEKQPKEEIYNRQDLNENLEICNYYFDTTPPKYIKGIISDIGILPPKKFVKRIKKILPFDWFHLFLKDNDQVIK